MLFRGLGRMVPLTSGLLRGFANLPAHETLKMPALSPTMTEGTIVKWLKKEGEKVKAGEIMFEVETDKATVGYEVQDDIYIAKILVQEGTSKISLGQPVAILVNKPDRVAAFKDFTSAPESSSKPEQPIKSASEVQTLQEEVKTSAEGSKSNESTRKFISPIAKNLAKEHGVDYQNLSGTGPNGRVIKNDILAVVASQASKKPEEKQVAAEKVSQEDRQGYKDVPHSSMRAVTAARLLESKQKIPHFYLAVECRMENLISLRKLLNEVSDVKVSVNDLVIKASALALLKVPEVNASWTESAIRMFSNVDISIAVQTPKGLITPIIKNAGTKRIGEIAKEAKELAGTAKEGKLKPEQFIGGTFTISNLGMFGVKEFSAIINPPQAAILAVGASDAKVVSFGEGFKVEQFMTVTLSCDHRVVDGAVGANWLKAFKGYIEEPYTMLL